MGAAADWGAPLKNIRGKDYPISGFRFNTPEHITIVDREHPVTQGVEDFDIVDEAYLCPMFEDSVHCLMRTDFRPVAGAFTERQAGHPPGSNAVIVLLRGYLTPEPSDGSGWCYPALRHPP